MSVSDAREGDAALRGGYWSVEGDKRLCDWRKQ